MKYSIPHNSWLLLVFKSSTMCMILTSSVAGSIKSDPLLPQMWWLLFTSAFKTGKPLAYIVVFKQDIVSAASSNHILSFQMNCVFSR